MRAALTLTLATILLGACNFGLKYPTFGEAAYRIEGTATTPDGAAPIITVIYRDGAKMRVETVLPGRGPATIVFDDATKAAYVITAVGAPAPPGATATNVGTIGPVTPSVQPAPSAAPPTTGNPGPPALSAPPVASVAPAPAANAPPTNAIGVAVRLDERDAPTPLEDAWQALGADGARSTGACTVAGESGHAWTPKKVEAGQAVRTACITDDGIVLQISEGATPLWQATKVDRGTQSANLFGIPPGYAIVDPKAVADTVSDTLNNLGSVAGEPKTPVTAQKR
jgi:hypothetical protein